MKNKNADLQALLDNVAPGARLTADGRIPAMAGAAGPQAPIAQPLGGATVKGTTITVDTFVNPPTKIPAIIRELVGADAGYFIERVFGTIGSPIQGGAVIVEETFPEDFFLPVGSTPAPRAPGAEAPRLAATRHEPKVKRPESWAGSIEVTDEAKQRNNVIAVRRQFTQAANSFSQIIQQRGIEVLIDAINTWERTLEAKTVWQATPGAGLFNVDPKLLPGFDIARVLKAFRDDKVGVRPDTAIMNTEELLFLETIYTGVGAVPTLDAVFGRQGITEVIGSPLVEEGDVIFCKAGAPGAIGWELPMSQEMVREGVRKTDVYVLECRPVFAAYDASAVWMLEGTDS
jgi:hypothetical protein